MTTRTAATHDFWSEQLDSGARTAGRADTVDKVKPEDPRANMAVMAFVLADMPETLQQAGAGTRQFGVWVATRQRADPMRTKVLVLGCC